MAIKLGFWIINAQIIALLFLANLHQQSVSAKDKDKGAKDKGKVDEKIKVYFFPATTEYKVNVYLYDDLTSAHKDLVASKFDDARAGTFFTLTQPDGRQVLTLLKEKLSGKYVILHFQSTSEEFKVTPGGIHFLVGTFGLVGQNMSKNSKSHKISYNLNILEKSPQSSIDQ